jgi:hypothetical protein
MVDGHNHNARVLVALDERHIQRVSRQRQCLAERRPTARSEMEEGGHAFARYENLVGLHVVSLTGKIMLYG